MKKFLPLVFVTLLLAGCASQGSTKMTDDQLFQKKQECAGYKSEMIKDLASHYNVDTTDFIKEIFYSPVINSCIYVRGTYDVISDTENRIITDFLTKKTLEIQGWSMSCSYFSGNQQDMSDCFKQGANNQQIINNKIKELKGE